MIGFDWTAPQGSGGLGSFPYPYAHVVRISESTHTVVDEPIIWNSSYAFAYPAVVANASGVLGATVLYGGGSTYDPGTAVHQIHRAIDDNRGRRT